MGYSGDPLTTERDMVRFLVGDTNDNDLLLSDEEYDALLTLYPNVHAAAAEAANAICGTLSRTISKSIGSLRIELGDKLRNYQAMADRLTGKAARRAVGAPVYTGRARVIEQDENEARAYEFDIRQFDHPGDPGTDVGAD